MNVTTYDAPKADPRRRFYEAKRDEIEYSRKLRGLAKMIVSMARDMLSKEPGASEVYIDLANTLNAYSMAITPWAKAVALKMINDVALRDLKEWRTRSREMSYNLEELIRRAPIGMTVQQRMQDQVDLITSIPRDIAEQVHQMAITTLYSGERNTGIRDFIVQKTNASIARANTIARTEVARTATEFTRARAEYVGSDGYVWRTSQDSDVRREHRILDGTVHKWNNPPQAGTLHGAAVFSHPGQIWNCRCVAEPVIPGFRPDRRSWKYVGGQGAWEGYKPSA